MEHSVSVIQTSQLMQYREIIAVCSEIHTKHINTLCGQNEELRTLNLAVHIVITGLYKVKTENSTAHQWRLTGHYGTAAAGV